MGRNLIETVMGAVVLLVAVFFLGFAYTQADLGTVKGYTLTASFQSVGGLDDGADVRINGIKVGTVLSQTIDPDSFNAIVRMSVDPGIHLPEDTVATVDSDGLLGDKYLKLLPGRSQKQIPPGGKIAQTRTYKSLEELVGQIIFLATDQGPGQNQNQGRQGQEQGRGGAPGKAPSGTGTDLKP